MWNSSYRRSDNEPTIPSSGFEFRCITLSVLGTISSPITMDNIKEEAGSATMDTTRKSFTGSSNDIKHTDAYNYIIDIKEEGTNVTEEGDSIMDTTRESFTGSSNDIKHGDAYNYISDIKEEGINVTEEGDSIIMDTTRKCFTGSSNDIKHTDAYNYISDIKLKEEGSNVTEEGDSIIMDTTRKCFTGSSNDIKHTDAYNYISDIKLKEEGINVTEEGDSIMDNNRDRFTSESDDVKVENTYMNNIKSEGTSVGIDSDVKEWNNYIYNVSDISQEGTTYYEDNIKEESDSSTMDNIGQNYYTTDNIDMKKEDIDMNEIKEEGISQNVDDIRENFTCDAFHIKVENTDCDDDIKADTISYDHGGTDQEDCDEARGAQNRGRPNLSEK